MNTSVLFFIRVIHKLKHLIRSVRNNYSYMTNISNNIKKYSLRIKKVTVIKIPNLFKYYVKYVCSLTESMKMYHIEVNFNPNKESLWAMLLRKYILKNVCLYAYEKKRSLNIVKSLHFKQNDGNNVKIKFRARHYINTYASNHN